jgi:hypothetical protein
MGAFSPEGVNGLENPLSERDFMECPWCNGPVMIAY